MALDLGELYVQLGVKTEGLQRAERAARDFAKKTERELGATGKATRKLQSQTTRYAKSAQKDYNRVSRSANRLKGAIAGIISLEAARRVILLADSYQILQQRLKTATRTTGDYYNISRKIFEISKQNGTALQTNVTLFQSLARSAPDLAATNKQMLILSRAVGQLAVIGGSSATEIKHGLRQFTQGLSAGIFRAEEFNSLLENVPELAVRIANGMDIPIGKLRKMVLAGTVLSKDVFHSLLKQAPEIAEQFKEIPNNIQRAGASFKNSFAKFTGEVDNIFKITVRIADSLQLAASYLDNMDVSGISAGFKRLAFYAAAAATGVGLYVGSVLVAIGATTLWAGAVRLLRAALIRSGIGIFIVLAGEAAYQLSLAENETNSFGQSLLKLKNNAGALNNILGTIEGIAVTYFNQFSIWLQEQILKIALGLGRIVTAGAKFIIGLLAGVFDSFIDKGRKAVHGIKGLFSKILPDGFNPFEGIDDEPLKDIVTILETTDGLFGSIDSWLKSSIKTVKEEHAILQDIQREKRDGIKKVGAAANEAYYQESLRLGRIKESQSINLRERVREQSEAERSLVMQALANDKLQEESALMLFEEQKKLDAELKRLKDVKGGRAGLESARKFLLTETEAEKEAHQTRVKAFRQAYNDRVITQEQYFDYVIKSATLHRKALADIEDSNKPEKDKSLDELKAAVGKRATILSNSLLTEAEVAEQHRDNQMAVLLQSYSLGIPLAQSYADTKLLIDKNYNEKVREMAEEKRALELGDIESRLIRLQTSYLDEKQLELAQHAESLQLIKDSAAAGLLTEMEYNALKEEEKRRHLGELASIKEKNIEVDEKQEALGAFLGVDLQKKANKMTLKEQGESFKKQIDAAAKESKSFFQLKKALALATAVVEAPKAILSAFTFGTEFGGPVVGGIFAGIAAAATAVQVAAIASSSFSGGKAAGGSVFAGGMYRVNENGPEMLSSGGKDYLMTGGKGGTVTPNNKLGGGGGSPVTVNVFPQPGQTARVESSESDSGVQVEVFIESIEERISAGIRNGGSVLSDTLESQFGLNRSTGAVI